MARLPFLKVINNVIWAMLKILISQVIAVIVIPPTILVYIINHLIVRSCLKVYLQVRFGGKIKLVNDSGDAMFGYKSEGNNRNILIALECEKTGMTHQSRKDQTRKFLNLKVGDKKPYEKLKWIFTKHAGYFCWKYDENFDLENHLVEMPVDDVVTAERLIDIVQGFSRDMDEEHPQWQFLFIPSYINEDGDDSSALVIRFHHGLLDGLSFVTFVSHCLGGISPASDDQEIEPSPETFPFILNPLKVFVPLKYRILYNINCILFGFYHLLRTVMSDKKHWNVQGKYPGKYKSYAFTEKIKTETLKIIRENCRVSVPSILACSFSQALEKIVGSRLPENEFLVGHSLAILPYPDAYFQNRFTLMTVPFKRSRSRTRIEKVKEYHRESVRAMQGPEYSLYYWFFQFYGKLPSAFFKYPLKRPRFSFLLNNLPFASKEVFVFNQRALKVIGWPPYTTDAGIGVSTVGYCDGIRVGGTADSSWLTKEELNNALKEMCKEIYLLAKECSLETV